MPALQKLSTIAFRWDFIGSFFSTRPRHHQRTEQQQKCQSEIDVDQVSYLAMEGRNVQNKHYGDTVPQSPREIFFVLFI